MSQSCFSLGFLSQNSLWKLSTFREYEGILVVCIRNAKSQFSSNRVFWQLNLTTGMSCESESRANYLGRLEVLSCSALAVVTLQLPCMLHTCAILATCQSRASCEIQS